MTQRTTSIPTLELIDAASSSLVELAPSRGGICTRFSASGRELFYLDQVTFDNLAGNVRGGNPVLFPSPGKLEGDQWARDGASGSMKQHGFARNLPWDVLERSADGKSITLRLCSSDVTRAQYPWDFTAEIMYRLLGPGSDTESRSDDPSRPPCPVLRLDMTFRNEGASPMPFGIGFHPYFAVPAASKARARVTTKATRAFDNVTKRVIDFTGFDFTAAEVDIHLLDHGSSECSLEIEGDPASRVVVRGSPEFRRWVVWTLQGRDFICVEPWTCPGNALNTGEDLLVLAPAEERALWLEYRYEGGS